MLKKIASNTIAQILSKVWTALISIILINLLTNYFSVELFWTYNKVYNYIYIFAFLVDLWLYAITIKEVSADKKNSEYIFWNILTLRILTWIFVLVFATLIASILPWYNEKLIVESIFILGFFAIFSLLNSSMLALMQSYMKMEFSLVSAIIWKLFILLATFFVFNYIFVNPKDFSNPFLTIIWIWAIWMFLQAFLNYLYAKKLTKIKLYFDFWYIKKIFITSLPYGLALFLSVVYTKIDIVLLSLIEKWAIAERSIALYSLPLKIMDVFMMIWAFLLNSLLPSLSQAYKEKNFKKIQKIWENTFKILLTFWIWIISLWIVFKNYVVTLIANPNYLEVTSLNKYTSGDAFNIVFFMLLFFYLWLVFSYILVATGRQNKLLIISIILTGVNIVWNILLIPKFSFVWAWMVTVFTQILFLILTYYFSKDLIKFNFPIKYIFINILAWILVYFIAYKLNNDYSLSWYYNLIYAFLLFFIYIWIFGFFEYKKFKQIKS